MKRCLLSTAGVLAVSTMFLTTGSAQGLLPLDRTYDIMIADTSLDSVLRLADLNQDRYFNGAGEILHVYDDVSSGGPDLANPSGIAFDTCGNLYASDTTGDQILRLIDLSGDGTAYQAGEWSVYLDATNLSGIVPNSVQEICFDKNNVMWAMNAGDGSYPLNDYILRIEDLNGDGDAQDAGEVIVAYDAANAALPMAVPGAIVAHPTLPMFYTVDWNPDMIFRMIDGNLDGDFNDAGETIQAYSGTLAGQPGLSFVTSMAYHPNGDLYCSDTLLDKIIVLRDLNGDTDFEDPGESWTFADKTVNSLGLPYSMNAICVDEHGRVFGTENGSSSINDGVILFEDLNSDGDADDLGETVYVYDATLGSIAISSAKEIALLPTPKLTTPTPKVNGGNTLTLDVKGFNSDKYQLLIGLNPLGYDHPLPPYGYLTHDLLLVAPTVTMDSCGDSQLSFPVPAPWPAPLPVHFTAVAGKLPYRYYLSNGITVQLLP